MRDVRRCAYLTMADPGDYVTDYHLLMELELIEPSLYLRTDKEAACRFARAFNNRFMELRDS